MLQIVVSNSAQCRRLMMFLARTSRNKSLLTASNNMGLQELEPSTQVANILVEKVGFESHFLHQRLGTPWAFYLTECAQFPKYNIILSDIITAPRIEEFCGPDISKSLRFYILPCRHAVFAGPRHVSQNKRVC